MQIAENCVECGVASTQGRTCAKGRAARAASGASVYHQAHMVTGRCADPATSI